jgi:hypothetical protein
MEVSILVFQPKPACQKPRHAKSNLFAWSAKRILRGLLLFTFVKGISLAQSNPEEVVFPSGGRDLHGFFGEPAPLARLLLSAHNLRI